MIKAKILGTIERNCPVCDELKKCVHFQIGKKQEWMCHSCIFKKYKLTIPEKKRLKWFTMRRCKCCGRLIEGIK